jgi:hypothetical protein
LNFEPQIYNEKVEFSVSDKFVQVLKKFQAKLSSKKQSTGFYSSQRAASKPGRDILMGKVGELLATKFFHQHDVSVLPDLKIRGSSEKNWDCDLMPSPNNKEVLPPIHVKSCDETTVRIVGQMSWTFQLGNTNSSGGKDKLFDSDGNDVVVFVYVESIENVCGTVVAVMPWKDVLPLLKDPKVAKYKGLKKCLYMDDI